VAKVDSAAVQDGFDLYLHGFIVANDGKWVVVQQGMKGQARQARRYHWSSQGLSSFVDRPHAAIEGRGQGKIVNLTDARAAKARYHTVDLLNDLGPGKIVREVGRLRGIAPDQDDEPLLPYLVMPDHHDVRPSDVLLRRLHASLAAAADRGPVDFTDLLQVPGVGARTVEALSMVAEVVHGAPHRFSDPARFSMAHGGKDGHPFPVPLDVYDQTITVLKQAVSRARIGQEEQLSAIKRLDDQARKLESAATGPSLQAHIANERARSNEYGGRTVFDDPHADKSTPDRMIS
jgi:hypothetical protein